MSETITEDDIRDTNTYTYSYDAGADSETLFQIVNDLDAEVTVTFYGTRQEDATSFTDAVQIGQLIISADAKSYETLSDNWEELQLEVVASTSPTTDQFRAYAMSQ